MKDKKKMAIWMALLAALLYAMSIPASKLLLDSMEPIFLASFLYFGAGIGMVGLGYARRNHHEPKLTRKELPYTIWMIVLDIIAPICLLFGLKSATSANVSLLNNFEIVVTALVALLLFKEKISRLMWCAIGFITLASGILSFNGTESLQFSAGSLLVVAACTCWGFENNCTTKISSKSATEIVMLKGLFSGFCSFILALLFNESFPRMEYILLALLLGFVSYGLSIFFYVKAQKYIGAAKTSAYYAANPYVAAVLSFLIVGESFSSHYLLALTIMLVGTILAVKDTLRGEKR